MGSKKLNKIGVVVIGRNEGERLIGCFDSIQRYATNAVYVDSGSSDESVTRARERGIETIELDLTLPFTAARARNEGFKRLLQIFPYLAYVQFVDGDCEIIPGWFENAEKNLEAQPEVAVICGRLRERYPECSIYNMLCDIEWDVPAGLTKSCGGIFMVRCKAFDDVGGFNPGFIAGEEPEFCFRLRQAGWCIQRVEIEMAFHDANITSFRQWWLRCLRAGYTFAEGAYLHGHHPERHYVKEARSAFVWGLLIPLFTIAMTWILGLWALAILAIYPVQFARTASKEKRDYRSNFIRAFYLILGRFPEALGGLKFVVNRITNRDSTIIEYK